MEKSSVDSFASNSTTGTVRLQRTKAQKEAQLLHIVDSHELDGGALDHMSLKSFLQLSKETKQILTSDEKGSKKAKQLLQSKHQIEGGADSLQRILKASKFDNVNIDGKDWNEENGINDKNTSPESSGEGSSYNYFDDGDSLYGPIRDDAFLDADLDPVLSLDFASGTLPDEMKEVHSASPETASLSMWPAGMPKRGSAVLSNQMLPRNFRNSTMSTNTTDVATALLAVKHISATDIETAIEGYSIHSDSGSNQDVSSVGSEGVHEATSPVAALQSPADITMHQILDSAEMPTPSFAPISTVATSVVASTPAAHSPFQPGSADDVIPNSVWSETSALSPLTPSAVQTKSLKAFTAKFSSFGRPASPTATENQPPSSVFRHDRIKNQSRGRKELGVQEDLTSARMQADFIAQKAMLKKVAKEMTSVQDELEDKREQVQLQQQQLQEQRRRSTLRIVLRTALHTWQQKRRATLLRAMGHWKYMYLRAFDERGEGELDGKGKVAVVIMSKQMARERMHRVLRAWHAFAKHEGAKFPRIQAMLHSLQRRIVRHALHIWAQRSWSQHKIDSGAALVRERFKRVLEVIRYHFTYQRYAFRQWLWVIRESAHREDVRYRSLSRLTNLMIHRMSAIGLHFRFWRGITLTHPHNKELRQSCGFTKLSSLLISQAVRLKRAKVPLAFFRWKEKYFLHPTAREAQLYNALQGSSAGLRRRALQNRFSYWADAARRQRWKCAKARSLLLFVAHSKIRMLLQVCFPPQRMSSIVYSVIYQNARLVAFFHCH